MQESVRIIDSEKSERAHGNEKMKWRYENVDAEARNAFNPKKVTASMMKCAHG